MVNVLQIKIACHFLWFVNKMHYAKSRALRIECK